MKTTHFLLPIALCCFAINISWAQQPASSPDKVQTKQPSQCRSNAGPAEIAYESRVDREAFRKRQESYLNMESQLVVQQYAVQFHIVRMDNGSGGVDVDDIRDEFQNFVNPYFAAIDIEFVECGPELYHNSSQYYVLGDGGENADAAGDAMSATWNVANVVNVYFVSDPDGACGWARFPWSLPADYIVMANSCADNQSTMVHELGHYFGLYHTHETALGAENVTRDNGNACWDCQGDGDLLCDTPADPNLSSTANNFPSCAYTGVGTDGCGVAYSPSINNIMSYADKACRTIFTAQQQARMSVYRDDDRDYLTIVNAPAITNPASNMTVECNGSGNTEAYMGWLNTRGGATVTDACGGTWSNNSSGLSNGCGATGSETVTFTYTSTSGNTVSTAAAFTIVDTTDPSLTCPGNIHLPECVETASWIVATSDQCGSVSVVSDPPSGSSFQKGTTTIVTVTATDACGNVAPPCTFEVTRDPDLVVTIDPIATNAFNTCALGVEANIVLGYGGGPTCVALHAVGSGGHAPYTYAWDAPPEVPIGKFTNTATASPTFCADFQTEACAIYTFWVTVTDIHGCTETNSIEVSVVNPLCTKNGNNPKVWVCHRPPGNPANQQSICIGYNAVNTHLSGHDDCLGHCETTCSIYATMPKAGALTSTRIRSGQMHAPEPYRLSVRPNPFHTTTEINFSTLSDTNIRLIVFDVNGREVARLFDGAVQKDITYAFDFEAENLNPGVYYAKLFGDDGANMGATLLMVR
jgi:HYR domain/Pregnancy-associated plasma protein-A